MAEALAVSEACGNNCNAIGLFYSYTPDGVPSSSVAHGQGVGTGMSMGVQGVYTAAPGVGNKPPTPHIRSHSLDQLNFEEKRQLIASTLSLSEFLGGGHQKSNKLKGDVVDGMDSAASTPIFEPTSTPLFTPTSNPLFTTSTAHGHNIVTKTASLSLSDLLSASKVKSKSKSKKGLFFMV